jgi:hypothetical protein
MFDLVIRGATVVDGSGGPGYRADVGVVGEAISGIGDLGQAEARRVIVIDNATYDDPRRYPTGIPFVVVNGQLAVDHERCTGVLAGHAVP